ncbi:MAG: alpha-amylase [bacterium]|nr:alpha-amylase [bacterium]
MNKYKIMTCMLAFILFSLTQMAAVEKDELSWYKEAVVYEAFVRSFYDADNDGKGDINGLIAKLDYLNDGDPKTETDLEVSAIWLMPVFSSPSYHGYDILDYYNINKDYGTMKDFERLLEESHKRGIRIIIDLVLNHTSDKHPAFLEARKGPDNPKRDWYVWKKQMPPGWGQPWSPHSKSNTVWHQAGDSYYYGLFYYGMPDLNYKNPEVIAEVKKVMKFWLDKGVDGFRLDAIRYLREDGPKLGQMDTETTHRVMADLYKEAKRIKKDCILIGEIWTDMDAISTYFKSEISPAQVDSAFNFDLSSGILKGIQNGRPIDVNVLVEITQETYPKGAIDSIFLTNHDMDRIASVIGADIGKLKLASSVLLTLPGVPYIYYGEEIAMLGKKPDEHIRRPMRWEKGPLGGFSTAQRPWIKPNIRYAEHTIADMEKDNGSLLNNYKKMIRLRNRNIALRLGTYNVVLTSNLRVYGFLRSHKEQKVLVLHNFSGSKIEGIKVPPAINVSKELLSGAAVTGVSGLDAYETKVYELKGD